MYSLNGILRSYVYGKKKVSVLSLVACLCALSGWFLRSWLSRSLKKSLSDKNEV